MGILQNLDDPDCPGRLVAWKVTVVGGNVTVQGPKIVLNAPRVWANPKVVNDGFVCATIDVSDYFDPEGGDIRAFRLQLGWDEENVWEVEGTRTPLFDVSSWAVGVNEVGSVCGRYDCPTNGLRAYLWTGLNSSIDLPGLPAMKQGATNYSATRYEYAFAVNKAAPVRIIGDASRSYTRGNYQHYESGVPLRWDIDVNGVRVVDLRTVTDGSPDLYSVGDINDAGWITSCTRNAGGGPESPVVLIPKQ